MNLTNWPTIRTSGYHHIEIFKSDQQFLGFSWVFNGVTKIFQVYSFTVWTLCGTIYYFPSYETFS